MTTSSDAHTSIAEAFQDLAIGGDKEPINRHELFSAIAQGHAVLASVGGGGGTLASLTDVNIPGPNNLDVLTYDSGTSKWIAVAAPAAGVSTFAGRSGAVSPLVGDYDAFFLTPAEGNAAYSALGHTHTFASLTAIPTTIGGYGITDFNSLGDARWSLLAHTHTFASLTAKPTTIGGYGITDFNSLGDARWSLLAHTHTAADVNAGTFADARIAASNVTQHQAALSIAGTQLTGLVPTARLGGGVADATKFLRGDQSWQVPAGGGSAAITQVIVVVAVPTPIATFTVVDAGVSPTSQVLVDFGNCPETDANHPSMDDITFDVVPGTGDFQLILYAVRGELLFGSYRLNYLVG